MAPLSVRSRAQLAHGRTAVYDHRGFVVRTRPVADLAAVLDAEGLDRVIVTGTSYGSYIAAAFAVTHPHRLAGLVLDSATLSAHAAPAPVPRDPADFPSRDGIRPLVTIPGHGHSALDTRPTMLLDAIDAIADGTHLQFPRRARHLGSTASLSAAATEDTPAGDQGRMLPPCPVVSNQPHGIPSTCCRRTRPCGGHLRRDRRDR